MKKLGILFVLTLLIGCQNRKELTASTAKSMLQERLDQEPNRANVPLDGYTKKLFKAETKIDYRTSPTSSDDIPGITHRLMDAGFVSQQPVGREYIDVTGHYRGDSVYPVVTHHYDISLQMSQGSADIKGKLSEDGINNPLSAAISGEAHNDDSISLTFLVSIVNGTPFYHGPFTYRLENVNGREVLEGPDPYGPNKISFTGSEPPNSTKISVPMFSYAFTPKAQVNLVNGSDQASLGRIMVTDVNSLLLASDTVATANFNWKFDYNELGKAITRLSQPKKAGAVQFGKQPDGTWVITGINM